MNMEPKKRARKLQRNTSFSNKNNKSGKGAGSLFLKFLGLIALLLATGTAAWGAKAYFDVRSAADSAYQSTGKESALISKKKPFSILILGVDTGIEGRKDRGNSDTMILVSINPKTEKAVMTSIPRDLMAQIKGIKQFDIAKINSSYLMNGAESSMATVSELLNVPVDYYATVDMKALENLVDALGGVEVDVPFSFSYDSSTFKKGKATLTGKSALAYARMRHDDPEGDYGRQKRQRQIIQAIVKKGMSLDGISNYQKILKVITKYAKTNMSFDDMLGVVMNYRGAAKSLNSNYIQGHDAWIGDAAYQVASTEDLQKMSDLHRKLLGLKKQTLKNEVTRQNALQTGLNWDDLTAFTNYYVYAEGSDTEYWQGL